MLDDIESKDAASNEVRRRGEGEVVNIEEMKEFAQYLKELEDVQNQSWSTKLHKIEDPSASGRITFVSTETHALLIGDTATAAMRDTVNELPAAHANTSANEDRGQASSSDDGNPFNEELDAEHHSVRSSGSSRAVGALLSTPSNVATGSVDIGFDQLEGLGSLVADEVQSSMTEQFGNLGNRIGERFGDLEGRFDVGVGDLGNQVGNLGTQVGGIAQQLAEVEASMKERTDARFALLGQQLKSIMTVLAQQEAAAARSRPSPAPPPAHPAQPQSGVSAVQVADDRFKRLFVAAKPADGWLASGAVVGILGKSGLPRPTLSSIWGKAKGNRKPLDKMNESEFVEACKMVIQAGGSL